MMKPSRSISGKILTLAAASLLMLTGSSCRASQPAGTPAPVLQLQEVTREVTREVTLEVTRLVPVPVTVTPSPTLEFTHTPSLTPTITFTPTLTATPSPPQATLLVYSNCLYGPAEFYLYKTSYPAGSRVEVAGRSWDARWINIREVGGWNACWIPTDQAQLESGTVMDLPFVYTALPLARYEYSPPTARAVRDGDEVSITWGAKWMSIDEIRGYLIEAWVCQAGEYTFLPVGITPTYAENVGTFTVTINDETGCAEPSRAHIATVVKKGYTPFEKIFWPPP